MISRIALLLVLTLLAVSCSAPVATPLPDPATQTPYPTYTPLPTYTPYPTHTVPPEPTATPTIEPTPSFARWSAQDAVSAFQAASLEAESPSPMTKDDYGMAPYVSEDAIHFLVPSLCSDCGGRIFAVQTPEDGQLLAGYYEELGRQSALFFSWVFTKDNLVIQINGDLPEEQALSYESVLQSLGD